MQRKIYQFNDEKELLVVTDLSNYYDSIYIEELRKVFVSLVEANEVVVDLLFKVIEGISWVPDYLPYSRRGLPTANIESIRLLAHSFLFEVDAVLSKKTNNSFARWMDDITIGVDSKKEAIVLLSSVSDMLKSRGLALNLSKTDIYDSDAAKHHFQIEQNQYLDSLESIEPGSIQASETEKILLKRFKEHFKDQTAKSWDKVAKRYITAFGRLKSYKILRNLPENYIKYPSLRSNLLIYLCSIGYSRSAYRVVSEIIDKIDIFDDLSLFRVSDLLALWEIPRSNIEIDNIKKLEIKIASRAFEIKEPLGFYSLLWFKAKYSSPTDLLKFLQRYSNLWRSNSFLRRQATICMARLLFLPGKDAVKMLNEQALSGVQGTVSVANQILQFSRIEKIECKIRMYLFPTHKQRTYPLGKFMVLCSVLNSEKIRIDKKVCNDSLEYITDPTYRNWLKEQYNIMG